jgi:hypothetical protein
LDLDLDLVLRFLDLDLLDVLRVLDLDFVFFVTRLTRLHIEACDALSFL